jgi:hypothetical protein
MITNRYRIATFVLALLLTACSPGAKHIEVAPAETQVVDIVDLFQTGHHRALDHLGQDSLLNQVWQTNQHLVVMVLIDILREDDEREQVQQSGILLDGGHLVLTAGHGFEIDDGKIEAIHLQGPAGQHRDLKLLRYINHDSQFPIHDWALLETAKEFEVGAVVPSDFSLAQNPALILGFPSGLGATDSGRVVIAREFNGAHILPLPLVVKRSPTNRNIYVPLAGTAPFRGISGAPVFCADGSLAGIFSSISRRRTLDGWTYIYHISDIPWRSIEAYTNTSLGP